MNLKKLIFSLVISIISISGFSQKDIQPGYIITNGFDTIQGFLNLKSNLQNSKSIDFRIDKQSEFKTYLPNEIRGYKIENSKFYVSQEIPLNGTNQSVFLEYLLHGIVDLFFINNKIGTYYFILKDGVLYQLQNDDEQVVIDSELYKKKTHQYIGMLNFLFKESPELSARIEKTPFGYKPLIAITKDYHNIVCKDQQCIDYTKSTQTGVWLEPNFGTSFSWMGFKTSATYVYNFNTYGGVNIRFVPFISHYVWNFISGISFSSSDFTGDFENTLFKNPFHITTKYKTIRIPFTVEYNFPERKIQPFLSLSFSNIFLLNSDYEILELYFNGTKPFDSDFRKYQIGLTFDSGLRFNLNKSKYIYLKNGIEFRKPATKANNALDYLMIYSDRINIGIGFTL